MAKNSDPEKSSGKSKKNRQPKIHVSLEEYKRRLGKTNLKVFSIIGAIVVSLVVGVAALFNQAQAQPVPGPAMANAGAVMMQAPGVAAWGIPANYGRTTLTAFVCQSCGFSGTARHVAGVGQPHPMCPRCGFMMTRPEFLFLRLYR